MRSIIIIGISLFLLTTGAALAGEPQQEPSPEAVCSSIINAKCTRCHYKTRICDALGTKSVGKWEKSIRFMVRQGAQLTVSEQSKVVTCLSSLPRGSQVVCD
jgi:hypothetical protein